MDYYELYAFCFLAIAGAALFMKLTSAIVQYESEHGWFSRHLIISRAFNNRYFDASRLEVACYIFYWLSAACYDAYKVDSLSRLSTRASQLSILNLLFTLVTHSTAHTAHLLGTRLFRKEGDQGVVD